MIVREVQETMRSWVENNSQEYPNFCAHRQHHHYAW